MSGWGGGGNRCGLSLIGRIDSLNFLPDMIKNNGLIVVKRKYLQPTRGSITTENKVN